MTHRIPFSILVTGHILSEIKINEDTVHMIIDTGASNTLISQEAATRLGLVLTPTPETATGAGGTNLEMKLAEGLTMHYKDQELMDDLTVAVLDISNIKEAVMEMDGIEIDGVLGADLFMAMSATIDYNERILTLQNN